MRFTKGVVALFTVFAMFAVAGVAGASYELLIRTRGSGPDAGRVVCPGGMSRLGHEFNDRMTIFPGDPAIRVEIEYTIADDGFLVEDIDTGAHAGTHLDVPGHFIDGGRTIDELAAEEFVWPAYIIDVEELALDDTFVERSDIRRYEHEHGRIKPGSLVVLKTGAEKLWGAETVDVDDMDNAANADDFFDFENAGFSGPAVQWLFDHRDIDGLGSDAYGPDAYDDADFLATFTALENDGVALVAIANLDSMSVRGDVIMAPTVALSDGSGFSTDPIACHGASAPGSDDADDDNQGDDDEQ